ncbi:MAG: iron chelate uptake ABC transporter family permease subunit [Solirubrobacterales bacterium]|nr:iron chelate uptake ABC transporter family permease subunit [Solirubrobacterales bacterium]
MDAAGGRAGTASRRSAARPRPAVLATGRARAAGLIAVLVTVALAAIASLAIGSFAISLGEVWAAFTAFDDSDAHVIVTELRVPRTEVGLLVGAALGAAGALMQGLTRNPLADPGILGINAGAAFAVVLGIFLLGISSIQGYVWFALLGAAVASVLVYALGTSGRDGATPVKLALAGAVLAALLVALTSPVLVFDTRTLDDFRFWIVGSIAGRDTGVVLAVAPLIAVGIALALASGRWLNALALGDEVARSLGQRVARARVAVAVGFVLLAGAGVAAAGPIAFVGLAVPHMARGLVGADYRWIVPYSIGLGAAVLLAGDVLARVVASPAELEVGIVTAVLGAPFFIALVRRRRLAEL